MKYSDAFDIAACAVQMCHVVGMRFRIGVTRAAALAVVGLSGENALEAMARAFEEHRLPRPSRSSWDGSIA